RGRGLLRLLVTPWRGPGGKVGDPAPRRVHWGRERYLERVGGAARSGPRDRDRVAAGTRLLPEVASPLHGRHPPGRHSTQPCRDGREGARAADSVAAGFPL